MYTHEQLEGLRSQRARGIATTFSASLVLWLLLGPVVTRQVCLALLDLEVGCGHLLQLVEALFPRLQGNQKYLHASLNR